MQANKEISVAKMTDVLNVGSTKVMGLIRDLSFFAFRLNTWFVFVEDLGREAEKKK
ncbi:hypothetical protein [Vibrio owensii]|uniref:hypothetical protein n=1 Tax=Vibrio owensii TaxID=696485 RepID=UPI0013CE6519|nr:hypothetical protein [Vibrio owensii]